jgi:hypothetical protein
MTDPDPESPKCYGPSKGSGSRTLPWRKLNIVDISFMSFYYKV